MLGKLLFISTNGMWSGSEELWTRSVLAFKKQGSYEVFTATAYFDEKLNAINKNNLYYNATLTYLSSKTLFSKLRSNKVTNQLDGNALFEFIRKTKPDAVIISQGNNITSIDIMQYCAGNEILFITLTQLVTQYHLLFINENNLELYQSLYKKALRNFFVSENNLRLNNIMLGVELQNAEVVYNPCRVTGEGEVDYPGQDVYNIGIVGRIECFHKGYDVLLEVIKKDKWRSRNICFNIYGVGPHTKLIKSNIERLGLTNIYLLGFTENIKDVWARNHILCMPSRMEGQALTLIEAMYFSRTAIVTDVGGASELIEENVSGFIAEACSITSLDAALEKAWNKRNDWEEMGKAANAILIKIYEKPAEVYLNEQIEKAFSLSGN
jgi:glycosyltransferase involved in cell wall biosynthesis